MNIFNSITQGLEETIKVESNEKEKMMFNYKVKDLIEELKKLPQELPVLTDGYEGDYENILKPFISIVKEVKEVPYWDGQFQELNSKNENGIEVLIIQREKR